MTAPPPQVTPQLSTRLCTESCPHQLPRKSLSPLIHPPCVKSFFFFQTPDQSPSQGVSGGPFLPLVSTFLVSLSPMSSRIIAFPSSGCLTRRSLRVCPSACVVGPFVPLRSFSRVYKIAPLLTRPAPRCLFRPASSLDFFFLFMTRKDIVFSGRRSL